MTVAWAFTALILMNYAGHFEEKQSHTYADRRACEAAARQAPWHWVIVKQEDGLCALVPVVATPLPERR